MPGHVAWGNFGLPVARRISAVYISITNRLSVFLQAL